MKKLCPQCGRNRRIDKKWNSCSWKGTQSVCKDCQSINNKRYRNHPKYKFLKKRIDKRYREKNKDKIKKYKAEYYQKNKQRILTDARSRKLTESVLIFENTDKKKINMTRYKRDPSKHEIVIDPKRK